jgi:hypothetical protein
MTTSTLTFTAALREAETLARDTFPERSERITQAVQLVKDGRVFQTSSGAWEVDSTTTAGLRHAVNGSCDCADAHYRGAPCKHQLSVMLARKVVRLMHPAPPQAPARAPEVPAQHAAHRLQAAAGALPEAPASVNVRFQVAGREVQLTLRDHDESALLARLEAVLAQYPLPQTPTQPASQEPREAWCAVHNTALHWNAGTHGRRGWFSHRLPEGQWCKGR